MRSHRLVELFWIFRDILRLPPVGFGLAMLVALWWGVVHLIGFERSAQRRTIAGDIVNLSRVFEQNVIRSLSEIDKTLLYLRHAHTRDGRHNNWSALIKEAFTSSEITFQLAIIDAAGRLIATDRGPQPPQPIDLSDRDHFRVHVDDTGDTLYISKPVLGRVTKQWSVQITRRFNGEDGKFAGVIVASLNPDRFSEFFRGVDLGEGGVVTLIGLDGVVRASGGHQPAMLGGPLDEPALADAVRRARSATTYYRDATTGDERIAASQWIKGYPLAVIVATNEYQPGNGWIRNTRIYLATALGITLLMLGAMVAITRRSARLAEARRQLYLKSHQHAVTLENISQGILMVDANGEIGFMNRRLTELLGLSPDFSMGTSYRALVTHLENRGEFKCAVDPDVLDFIRSPQQSALIPLYERERPDGTVLSIQTKPLPDGGFVRTFTDITGRRRAEAKVLQLACQDTLTGLSNRAVFRQQLEECTRLLKDGRTFAVHMIDLDRFKPVNDTHGHLVGDQLLKEVAERLRICVRAGDLVGRLGGDEFAVIQMGAHTHQQGKALADRICRSLCQPYSIDGHTINIGASVGVAFAPVDETSAQGLLHSADLALYSAKANSRGTVAFFRQEMHEEHCARAKLEEDLRHALADNQFELHYQPIVSIGSGQIAAYEALIRWRHPERGFVPPLEFIGVAEDTGLIGPIGAWVIETACKDISRRECDARIAVNLSPVQFRDPRLVDMIVDALRSSGLPPERLEIEITESALLQNDQLTQKHLEALRALGIHITMDDFGTGYSSLSYLMSYPIQSIKIDRSFVQGLGQKTSSTAIVRTITTLAANLGLSTTAEGVETVEQLNALRDMGCTEAQGYYFSKPKPAAEILPPRDILMFEAAPLRAAS